MPNSDRRASQLVFALLCFLCFLTDVSAQSQGQAQPANQVSRYINAFQKRDFRTLIDLTYRAQQEIQRIKEANPQVLWPRLIEEYYQNRVTVLSRELPLEFWLPASSKWAVTETRRAKRVLGQEQDAVYVTVQYPSWPDAPLVGYKLLDKTIMEFHVEPRSQLVDGWDLVSAGDVYKEEPLRILNVMVGESLEGMRVGYGVVGGTSPLSCSVQFGSVQRQQDCSTSASFKWEELGFPEGSGFGWQTKERGFQVHLKVADAKGRTDEVSLSVSVSRSQLFRLGNDCWIREPWFGKGLGRPSDFVFCGKQLNRLGTGTSASALGTLAKPPESSNSPASASEGPGKPVSNELKQRIQRHIRTYYSIPSDVQVEVGERRPSEFTGYDLVTVTLIGQRKTLYEFLVSQDEKTLIRYAKIDIAKDP